MSIHITTFTYLLTYTNTVYSNPKADYYKILLDEEIPKGPI